MSETRTAYTLPHIERARMAATICAGFFSILEDDYYRESCDDTARAVVEQTDALISALGYRVEEEKEATHAQ